MTNYLIIEASPQAKALVTSNIDPYGTSKNSHHRAKYPFAELEIGKCFTVPISEANEVGLRSSSVAAAKREEGKKFTVIKHREHGIFEVARIA